MSVPTIETDRDVPTKSGRSGSPSLWRVRVLTVVGILVLWEVVATLFEVLVTDDFFPHLWTLAAAYGDVFSARFAQDVAVTGYQLFWGLLIGISAGLFIGLLLGLNALAREIVEPLLVYLATVPKIVLYPILLLFLTVGTDSKIAMAALSTFFPVVLHTITAATEVRPLWLNAGRVLRCSPLQRLRFILLPAMAPSVYAGVRLGIAAGIIGTLMAETKAADAGVGFRVIEYYNQYDIPQMYAVLILVFVFSIVLASALGWLGRRLRLSSQDQADEGSPL